MNPRRWIHVALVALIVVIGATRAWAECTQLETGVPRGYELVAEGTARLSQPFTGTAPAGGPVVVELQVSDSANAGGMIFIRRPNASAIRSYCPFAYLLQAGDRAVYQSTIVGEDRERSIDVVPGGSGPSDAVASVRVRVYLRRNPVVVRPPAPPFVCALPSPRIIRPGDVCAREGGRFSARRGSSGLHRALDINSTEGEEVRAIRAGRVVVSTDNWGAMGHTVMIDHGDGYYSIYGHLSSRAVELGAQVTAAQRIGAVGFSGNADCLRRNSLPPHLHLGIYRMPRAGLVDGRSPPLRTMDHEAFLQSFLSQSSGEYGAQDPEAVLRGLGCWL